MYLKQKLPKLSYMPGLFSLIVQWYPLDKQINKGVFRRLFNTTFGTHLMTKDNP